MTLEEILFTEIGEMIKTAEYDKVFGKPCFAIGDKAFIIYDKNCVFFKLDGEMQHEALSLSGSELADPSGKKISSTNWVRVTYRHHYIWPVYAKAASEYVSALN